MSAHRVAIVTGANKGIGFAIVRALCKKFDGVVYLTARDEGRGNAAVKELESEGLKPRFHKLDVSDRCSVDELKNYMKERYGGVDVLVHNAAIAFKQADTAPFSIQAKESVAVNFTGAMYLCNEFLPIMKEGGRISIVSSTGGVMSLNKCSSEVQKFFKSSSLTEEDLVRKVEEFVEAAQTDNHVKKGFSNSAYGMSKLGLTAFTRILAKNAQKLDQQGVLVNCCCPGYVNTDMSSHKGHKTPDQGAETPVYLALLPKGAKEPQGEFLSDKEVKRWYE